MWRVFGENGGDDAVHQADKQATKANREERQQTQPYLCL